MLKNKIRVAVDGVEDFTDINDPSEFEFTKKVILSESPDSVVSMNLEDFKDHSLESIKVKATSTRQKFTKGADVIYLLGLANKADIGRAVINKTATALDIAVITEELKKRKAKGRSPKSHTIEKLANEQIQKQAELVGLANFVEDFEDDAIEAIEAQTDIEGIQNTLAALDAQADAAIQQLLSQQ